MNRPKKNKISNPTLPEDQQTDERNLVEAGESEEVSFEDRLHLYWMENKGFISGCIAVLALLVIGYNGMKIYVSYSEDQIQAAYAEAKVNDTLRDFAKEQSGKSLGGLAALNVADKAYTAEDYATAIEFYGISLDSVENDILLGRAKIGQAFATFYNGEKDEGLAQLRGLAADTGVPEAVRAEAAYHLAVNADVSGDAQAFENYASQVASISTAGRWQQRMELYRQQH